jgi:hypothetical protein
VVGTDHDVAELARTGDGAGAVQREGEDVGGPVASAVLAVELTDPLLSDQLHREMHVPGPLPHAGRPERRGDGVAQLGGDVAEIEAQPGFWRSE